MENGTDLSYKGLEHLYQGMHLVHLCRSKRSNKSWETGFLTNVQSVTKNTRDDNFPLYSHFDI